MPKQAEMEAAKIDGGPVDAVLTCSDRSLHGKRLNQTCPSCDTHIPGHGMYSTEEFNRYFSPNPFGQPERAPLYPGEEEYRERNRIAWEKYEELNRLREKALFDLDDAKQGAA